MGSEISQLEKVVMKIILLVLLAFNSFAFDQTHEAFDKVLKTYTSKKGSQVLVDYKSLAENQGDLDTYLKQLEALKKIEFNKFSKDEQLAFWINAYNAYTLKLIIKNYPVKSIKDIGGLFSGPWDQKFIYLMGKNMTLNKIEHGTIRKQFKEPRIHFAVNCASIGCPSLLQEAFVGSKLDTQLETATKNFLANNEKNFYDKSKNTLFMSKIFKWYGGDFEDKFGSKEQFISKYIEFPKNADTDYLDYNWNLNE
jgi:hypothetical protein